tara:strand:- start:9940 stop:12288 length:2349 start_codon:yes stop_codon:yes gene_type:complete
MASSDAERKINGIDRMQEEVATLSQGSNSQYILAALTPELLEKPEYSKVSVGGRSDRIITLNKDVHPFTFDTYLQSQGTGELSNVFNTFNNAQLTSLTPMIKFFLRGDETKEVIPIPLQNMHNSLNPGRGAYDSVNKRYSYLGIKQIDISLAGTTPETKKADIESSVTFYGNNLSVFERGGQGETYLPLIVPYYTRRDSKNQAGNHYQLMMQVGWNVPTPGLRKGLNFTKKQIDAITAQQATYIMRYYNHGFSFNEDGSFQLKVDYISAIDEFLKDVNFLEPSSKEIDNMIDAGSGRERDKPTSEAVGAAINDLIKTRVPSAGKRAKKKIVNYLNGKREKDALKEIERLEIAFSKRDSDKLKGLVRSLLQNRAGFTIELSPSYVQHLFFDIVGANHMDEYYAQENMSGGDKYTFVEYARENLLTVSREQAGKDFQVNQISTEQRNISGESLMSTESDFIGTVTPGEMLGVYNFFKFGDVITAFLASSNGEKYFKENDFRIILGNIRIPVQSREVGGKKKVITASLYDIPIALESLMKIIYEDYINTTRKRLTFKNFISSLLTKVIKPYFVERDFVLDHRPVKNSIRTGQIVVNKNAAGKIKDNIREGRLKKINLRNPRINLMDQKESKNLTSLFFISVSSPSPPQDDKMLKSYDKYTVGSAQSIIKKVSFNQANSAVQKARADDNVVASLRNEDSVIIPQVYNVSLDIIGNVNFFPGYSFNLQPTLLGLTQGTRDSILETLGLTGTYMTLKVEHSFSSSGFTTSLEAYNVYVDKKAKKALKS